MTGVTYVIDTLSLDFYLSTLYYECFFI